MVKFNQKVFPSPNIKGKILTKIDQTWSMILLNVLCFLATIYGYNLIHKMQKLLSWASLCIYIVAIQLQVPAGSWVMENLDLPLFLLAVSMVATWQLAYAPYVADYSRYLPITTPTAHTFWYSYAGSINLGGNPLDKYIILCRTDSQGL